jgi:citrate lyase beta subunit
MSIISTSKPNSKTKYPNPTAREVLRALGHDRPDPGAALRERRARRRIRRRQTRDEARDLAVIMRLHAKRFFRAIVSPNLRQLRDLIRYEIDLDKEASGRAKK